MSIGPAPGERLLDTILQCSNGFWRLLGVGIAVNQVLEIDMTTADTVLETLIVVDRHVRQLTVAKRVDEVIRAASAYLASWPSVRIRDLQKVDGGWGPFDFQGQPKPIHGVAEIARISDSLRRQCSALNEAGIDPTPELLELDLFFAFAKEVVQTILPAKTLPGTATYRAANYSHWSDQDSAAA